MKILIASDIHGSATYCRQLLGAYAREGAQLLLLLGDILYHGPRNDLPDGYAPKEVIAMLNPLAEELFCVRGNCEAEVDQTVLNFPVMAECALIYTGALTLYATHGHIYNEEDLPPMKKGSVLLNGHTHIPKFAVHENYAHINPGSVSIPKAGSARGYVLLEGRGVKFKTLEGNAWAQYAL